MLVTEKQQFDSSLTLQLISQLNDFVSYTWLYRLCEHEIESEIRWNPLFKMKQLIEDKSIEGKHHLVRRQKNR